MKNLFAELRRRNVVRVAAFYVVASWLILQVADVLFGLLSVPDWSLRFVLGLLLLGFPVALIFSWVYEITPDGLKRERDLDRSDTASRASGKKLDAVTIALLVVTIGLLGWDRLTRETVSRDVTHADQRGPADATESAPAPSKTQPDLSIAVLPFANMSDDASNEYFSDGLSEELLNLLAQVPDFRVAGRTSSFAFKGKNEDLRSIGEKLSVAHILEGSVRRQGDQIRVTAQLISAEDGYHLWSETYDDELEDVFAIQDAIARSVVEELKTTLLPAEREAIASSATQDVEAYRHYLKGRAHARTRTPESLEQALAEFQQATLIDPDFAPPYAGMAAAYALMDNYGYRSLVDTGPVAERAIERALALDPTASDAWAAKGLYLSQRDDLQPDKANRAAAQEAFRKALEFNPSNAHAYLWLSTLLLPDDEASREAENKAYELDPLSPIIVHRQAVTALGRGLKDEARARVEELKTEAPEWFLTYMREADLAALDGRGDRRALALETARSLNPDYWGSTLNLANLYFDWGMNERALALLDEAPSPPFQAEMVRNVAWLRAEMAVAGGEPAAALAAYLKTTEDLPPDLNRVAEAAMLEIAAGDPAAAERRIRGVPELENPTTADLNGQTGFPVYALSVAMHLQGRGQEAAPLVTGLEQLVAEQVDGNGGGAQMIMIRSWLLALEGRQAEAAEYFRRALDKGYRENRSSLNLVAPQLRDLDEADALFDAMDARIRESVSRYEAQAGREARAAV